MPIAMTAPLRVLIADDPHPVAADLFRAHGFAVDQIKKITPDDFFRIGDFDALIVRSSDVKDKIIYHDPRKLRVISRAGTGYDNIDRQLANEKGIVVMNAPDGNAPATAELTMAHMLNLARKITVGNKNMRAGAWTRAPHGNDFQVRGKKLGIIGCGRIGSLVARYAKTFGMDTIVYDPYVAVDKIAALGAKKVETLHELLSAVDIITLHPDLNAETRKVINADTLRLCKKGVYLINCARGPLVDQAALAQAIQEGIVAGAALDVIDNEPTKVATEEWKANPLFAMDQVVFTPHIGGTTKESLEDVARQAAEQVIAYLRDGIIMNAVNMPVKATAL